MSGLSWLHLSDWHQKGPDFNRTVVFNKLMQDIRDRAKIDPSLAEIDFVVFSGDVAWQGKKEEFEAARKGLFEPLLEELKLKPDRLFIVPGNHDLSRECVEEMMPEELKRPLDSEKLVQKWLTDEKKRARALEPFEEFSNFISDFTRQNPSAYANTWVGFLGSKKVGILCLNSAWMCGRNKDEEGKIDDRGKLILGEPQIHEALEKIKDADLRIAILHHPFSWLTAFDQKRIEIRLRQSCHFVLHGHEHEQDFCLTIKPSGNCAVIPAGASFESRTPSDPHYANAFNFVHLDFEAGKGLIYFRRWNDEETKWVSDSSLKDGKFTFPLPEELRSAVTSQEPAAPSPLSPAIQSYRHRLEEETSKLKLVGLGQGVQIELPIDQAYIPLNVVISRSLKTETLFHFDDKSLRQGECFEENVLLCDIFKQAVRFKSRGVLLLGDPGAGKTTGARQFCWRVLNESNLQKKLGLPETTQPVFLRLRQLTPHHLGKDLKAFITDSLAAPTLPENEANPGPELLARKGVLWVFDGLDEVVNEKARVHVCGWITKALEDRPDDFFLVTSRYQGYQGDVNLGAGFCQFHVKPLNSDQINAFVEHWYLAVCRRLHGEGKDTDEKALAISRSLNNLLQEPAYRIGRLRDLPANPLMLTILCVVHHQDRNLPRRRADLYAKCVRVLVEHWRREVWKNQGVDGFDPESAECVLSVLAWWLHEQENRTTQSVEELGTVATKALADLSPNTGLGREGVEFVKRMRDHSGILVMWSAGQCGFLHLTFQEYLAGWYATRENQAGTLVKHIGKSWWREVILVAVAIGSRDFALKFFTALLKDPDVLSKEPAFVDQCLEEARFTVLEPFIEALKQPNAKPERQLEILRRLRRFDDPGLVAICRDLARSSHTELDALAVEVLQRNKIEVPQPKIKVVGTSLELRVYQHTGIAFMTIPAGEFDMGSATGRDNEQPVHRVRITKPFLLGKYPVTNREYQRYLEANSKVGPPDYWNNSQFNDPQQPVVGVSWEDVQGFCEWAKCRLPTEAEWEYACRAGSKKKYCFGDDVSELEEYAWYSKNSGYKTQPVGQKKSNQWGLHDMHGNVWEWCQDWHGPYTKGPVIDPTGQKEGESRVLRGGSWYLDGPEYLSCSYRFNYPPVGRGGDFGFRCVLGSSAPG